MIIMIAIDLKDTDTDTLQFNTLDVLVLLTG